MAFSAFCIGIIDTVLISGTIGKVASNKLWNEREWLARPSAS